MTSNTYDAIRKRLAQLPDPAGPVSLSQHISALLPEIEAAIARGTSYRTIAQTLTDAGVPISTATFGVTLHRIRAVVATTAAGKKAARAAKSAQSAAVPAAAKTGTPTKSRKRSAK